MTVDPRLLNGEIVQWQGQSDPRAHFTRTDVFFVPFSIVWLGFAVFWTVNVASSPTAPAFMWLFGLAFVALGLLMAIGRFFIKASTKRRTQYFLTDRRAIVASPSGVSSIDLQNATPIVTIHRGGSHMDVTFGMASGPLIGMPGMRNRTMYANTGLDFFAAMGPGLPVAFYDVTDVDALTEALASRTAPH